MARKLRKLTEAEKKKIFTDSDGKKWTSEKLSLKNRNIMMTNTPARGDGQRYIKDDQETNRLFGDRRGWQQHYLRKETNVLKSKGTKSGAYYYEGSGWTKCNNVIIFNPWKKGDMKEPIWFGYWVELKESVRYEYVRGDGSVQVKTKFDERYALNVQKLEKRKYRVIQFKHL